MELMYDRLEEYEKQHVKQYMREEWFREFATQNQVKLGTLYKNLTNIGIVKPQFEIYVDENSFDVSFSHTGTIISKAKDWLFAGIPETEWKRIKPNDELVKANKQQMVEEVTQKFHEFLLEKYISEFDIQSIIANYDGTQLETPLEYVLKLKVY